MLKEGSVSAGTKFNSLLRCAFPVQQNLLKEGSVGAGTKFNSAVYVALFLCSRTCTGRVC